MSWLSTGIFAGLGFAIGGPIGAGIGAMLGSSIGKAQVSSTQKNQTVFFVSLFSMLSKMAIADGVVSQHEIDVVRDFMKRMSLDAQDEKTAITIFRNAKTDEYSIYDYAQQYQGIASQEMRQILYGVLWEVALSDGVIHQEEQDILQKIPRFLGIPNHHYESFNQQKSGGSAKNIQSLYPVLGCEVSDDDATIKTAYRRLMKEYHPDKIQSKGLPKSFIQFANEQTKKINEAYRLIKQDRGM